MKQGILKHLVVIRGGGDITSGVAVTLRRIGYRVLILEQARPTTIRRGVSFSDAVYDGVKTIERITCRCAASVEDAQELLKTEGMAMLVDPSGRSLFQLKKKFILIDSVHDNATAENNWPTAFIIGLGEGFCAGQDVDCVIDLVRGFSMGRIITEGRTPRPERNDIFLAVSDFLVKAPVEGVFTAKRAISSITKIGDAIGEIIDDSSAVHNIIAPGDGVLRGLIRDGYRVTAGMNIAEVDMRVTPRQCTRVADRARAVAGGVLEAILTFENGCWTGGHRFHAALKAS